MTTMISYSAFSSKTGGELRHVLSCKRAKTWSGARRALSSNRNNIIINWGATEGDGLTAKLMARANAKMINHPVNIVLNKDKHGSLVRMKAGGVVTPDFWKIDDVPDDAFPVVARTRNHFGGSGFWKCTTRGELLDARTRGATHALKLIVKSAEYRVHVLLDKPIRIVRKVKAREDASDLCRSHKNGWKFLKVANENIPAGLVDLAVLALKSIGLQMGAVDVVTQKKTGRLMVLEVNSTPGLEGNSLQAWAKAISDLDMAVKQNGGEA